MITKSQQVMLDALKTLFGYSPSFPEDTDWNEVINEAKVQTVYGLISSVIPVIDETIEQGKAAFMRIIFEQERIQRLFDSAGIPFVILKGAAAAVYYPKPYLRTMGDIDILVPRKRFKEAASLLESVGYSFVKDKENYQKQEIRHVEYIQNGVEIELHHHFSWKEIDIDDVLEAAIDRRVYFELYGYRFPMLPLVENGLVLLCHLNHNINEGELGLRHIIDWAMYVHYAINDETWYKSFGELAKQYDVLKLANYVTKMCNDYIGLPDSLTGNYEVDVSLSDELINIVLNDGNFGIKLASNNSIEERRVLGTIYDIKNYGLIKFLIIVGEKKWKYGKKKTLHKPFALIYGFHFTLVSGVKAIFKKSKISRQVKEGKRRYELFKKLGVRFTK